ncbi:GntR family transcriptional regulator [Paracoccus sp. (in: a-proteobacteria)]|uniref:GntR family transcriptional regulator n=1 Tax=Paracoccus sp. TaxID=267 RepID=UPI002AFFD0A3|nr:GntR family transcriptional regulator [Paracoccus sp. (in: a-proteobacteria)]
MSKDALSALLSANAHKLLRNDLPTPLYHQMFSLLRDRILNGEIPRGSRIPTEFDLAEGFGVSRITAKRALDELAAEGLVERCRGKGTHVIHRSRPKPMHSPLTGLLESLEVLAEHTKVQLLQFRRAVPPEPIRALFDTGPRETLVQAIRLRLRGDTPFGYYISWTRTEHEEFSEAKLANSSRLKLFDAAGIHFKQVEQVLSALNADAISALHLKVEPGTALLSLERRSYDGEGQLVDLLNVQYRPDQFTYQMTLDVEDGTPL